MSSGAAYRNLGKASALSPDLRFADREVDCGSQNERSAGKRQDIIAFAEQQHAGCCYQAKAHEIEWQQLI